MEDLDMATRRIIISIPDEDKLWLEGYSKVHQISVAEAIRQGIDQLKKANRQQTYRQLVEKTRGVWKKGDGLAYQEKLRAEWE
jgi:Mor family transcriptional regulator